MIHLWMISPQTFFMSKPKLSSHIPPIGKKLVKFSGKEMIDRVGEDVINDVVTSILSGGNVRSLTEGLTQRRILLSNASLFLTFLKGFSLFEDFEENINSIVSSEIIDNKLKPEEKIFLQYFLGFTGKSIQNVLRNNPDIVEEHLNQFSKRIKDASQEIVKQHGEIEFKFMVAKDNYLLKWPSLLQMSTLR